MKLENVIREQAEPRTDGFVRERNVAQRRLAAIAAAVRDHERLVRGTGGPPASRDLQLYSRVRRILGEQR